MNEKELGEALLRWDVTKQSLGADPHELTSRVLQRDKRRVWWLSALATVLWSIALLGIVSIFVAGGFAFPRIAELLKESPAAEVAGDHAIRALAKITAMHIVITSMSVISLIFAGFGTLILVRASRNATLRQVHAGLVEISDQIRALHRPESK